MIVRITDSIQSIPKEARKAFNQERLDIVQEVLDYFVCSENQMAAQFELGSEAECFLNAFFNTCARRKIEALTFSQSKTFGQIDIVDKAKVILPILFSNFQVDGNTVSDKLELVKAYIDSINKHPNVKGEQFILKSNLRDLKHKVAELQKYYNKTLYDLDNAPDNDADGGCRWRNLREISDEAEMHYNAVLAQIPKNSRDTAEVTKYYEPDYHIYNDYILTPSLFGYAGAKTNSKALVFDKNFLAQFATELMIRNISCQNVEMEAQKILIQFLQVEASPTEYFQASAFTGSPIQQ